MSTYKFSVGKLKLYQGASLIREIIPTKIIEINYNLTTHKEIEADGTPVDEIREEENLQITCEYVENTYDVSLVKGLSYDVVLETGVNSGGISATIAGCKLVGYSLRTSQDEFATGTLTFSKIGAIDSVAGSTPTKQKVKFGSVYIGDSAYVVPEYVGNAQSLIIPTALGVLCRSTTDMGGGQLNIRVAGYVKKTTRLEMEQYLISLYNSLATTPQTLTVEFGLTNYTITNCYWVSGRPDGNKKTYTNFELEFIKSAY